MPAIRLATQNAALEPTSAITLALWARPTNTHAGTCADLVRKAGPGQRGYLLRWSHDDGILQFRLDRSPSPNVAVTDTVPNSTYLNSWHHFAASYDSASGAAVLYVDGEERRRVTGLSGALGHSADLYLMGQAYAGHGFIGDRMDDVRIYSRALTAEEVLDLIPTPAIGRSPGTLSFSGAQGGPDPAAQAVPSCRPGGGRCREACCRPRHRLSQRPWSWRDRGRTNRGV